MRCSNARRCATTSRLFPSSKINSVNFNLFTTVSSKKVNEGHFSFSREDRPRSAVTSNIPADTAMGFAPSFRFGHPFFLGPNIDEVFKRTQVRDNFSIVSELGDQFRELQPVHYGLEQKGKRRTLQLLTRRSSALRRYLKHTCGHGDGLRSFIPVWASVFPGTQYR